MGPKAVAALGINADDFPEPARQVALAVLDCHQRGEKPERSPTVQEACRRMGFDPAGGVMQAAVTELKRRAVERRRWALHRTIELLPQDNPARQSAERELLSLMGQPLKAMKVVG